MTVADRLRRRRHHHLGVRSRRRAAVARRVRDHRRRAQLERRLRGGRDELRRHRRRLRPLDLHLLAGAEATATATGRVTSAAMEQILDAIEAGATRRRARAACPSRSTTAPPSCCGDEQEMFAGMASADKDPRKSLHVGDVRDAGAGARRGVRRGDGQSSINFNTVWTSIFEPLPTFGFLDRLGRESEWGARHDRRLPRGRLRRLRRRAARRLGGAQLEAGRPGHRALQLRRRPGPVGARRLDAGRQPAHLGLRDELRRPRRPRRGEGQPADAQAHPPHVGGGGGQRAVQLHQLPDARRRARRPHEAGRRRAGVGRHRRHRRLRRAVRAQRRRHARSAWCRRRRRPSCSTPWASRR